MAAATERSVSNSLPIVRRALDRGERPDLVRHMLDCLRDLAEMQREALHQMDYGPASLLLNADLTPDEYVAVATRFQLKQLLLERYIADAEAVLGDQKARRLQRRRAKQ